MPDYRFKKMSNKETEEARRELNRAELKKVELARRNFRNLYVAPNRMQLIRLARPNDPQDSPETLVAQFNPEELEETLKVDYAKLGSPGFTQKRHHYLGTENLAYSFTLIFSSQQGYQTAVPIAKQRRQLMSFCYPKRYTHNVVEGDAPRILFIWPNLVSLTCVITELQFRHEMFASQGSPTRFTVGVRLESIGDMRLYADEVLEKGAERYVDENYDKTYHRVA